MMSFSLRMQPFSMDSNILLTVSLYLVSYSVSEVKSNYFAPTHFERLPCSNQSDVRCLVNNCSHCKNGAMCLPSDGECVCASGWTGRNCEFPCPSGFYGRGCVDVCECKNSAGCDPVDGSCICRSGFQGSKCEKLCERGTWGHSCLHNCSCFNGASCLPSSGICICLPGYSGEDCSILCSYHFFAGFCVNDCACENYGWCHKEIGTCVCAPGFKGDYCQDKCEPGTFGFGCNSHCICGNTTTNYCDNISGKCACKPGWTGMNCTLPCTHGTWGESCNNTCQCNNMVCHHITGECICEPGWAGRDCSQNCPVGTFGENCMEICHCNNGSKCEPQTGSCVCENDWINHNCSIDCPSGTECSLICSCNTGNDCNYKYGCIGSENLQDSLKSSFDNFKEINVMWLYIVGGICVAFLIVVGVTYFVILKRKRKREKVPSSVCMNHLEVTCTENAYEEQNVNIIKYANIQAGNGNNYQELDYFLCGVSSKPSVEYYADSYCKQDDTKETYSMGEHENIYQEVNDSFGASKYKEPEDDVFTASATFPFQGIHCNKIYDFEGMETTSGGDAPPQLYTRLNLPAKVMPAEYDKLQRLV